MKENTEQNSGQNKARSFFGFIAAEKKKSITAVCLLTVMTLMWARVFMGKSPQIAPADQNGQTLIDEHSAADANSAQQNLPVSFIELPKIEGRNDHLTRDFFVFKGDGDHNMNSMNSAVKSGIIKKIESLIKVDVIVMGNSPQAFINNRLFKAGDKINISDGNGKYDCVIEKISETEVLIDCMGIKIVLKIVNPLEVIDKQ